MKNIIIFGATGNIGLYLVNYILEHFNKNEYNIIAVGRRKTSYFDKIGVRYISMDIRNKQAFDELPSENVFAAIHLANILPARMSYNDPYSIYDINLYGSLNILEYLRKVKAEKLIFSQTYADIAGYWDKQIELRPDLNRNLKYTGDHALYAISKCSVVDIAEYYHQTFGLKNYVLRLPNIYMYFPEDYYYVNGEKKLISYRYMIRRAIKGEMIELWGNPQRIRDIVYIKDFCQLASLCITADNEGGLYNVGTGVGTTLEEQIKGIVEIFSPKDRKSEIIYCPEKPDAMQYIMNIDNAKKELGYNPQYMYLDYLRDYKKEMMLNRFKEL
ncbi:MAG: NAD(P)-dependent oxidoreductase [Ruminococcaceae bacterium]|nr:NAD(P)-dependent oxidoreductase [Oscillospiraceae bacterium]